MSRGLCNYTCLGSEIYRWLCGLYLSYIRIPCPPHPTLLPRLRSCIGSQRAEGRTLHSGSNRPLAVPPLRGQPWWELVDDLTWSSRAGDHTGLALKLWVCLSTVTLPPFPHTMPTYGVLECPLKPTCLTRNGKGFCFKLLPLCSCSTVPIHTYVPQAHFPDGQWRPPDL